MTSIKGHFDGNSVVLDEPTSLEIGQIVRVVVESPCSGSLANASLGIPFNPHLVQPATLLVGEDADERMALHIDPMDRVPADFVRQPGSGAGEIMITDDLDAKFEGFEDYV